MISFARNNFIDQIKGCAILGVIYIHAAHLVGQKTFADEFTFALSRMAVPIFLVIFSFFLEKSVQKEQTSFPYGRRLKTLLLPFIFWSSIYFLVTADFPALWQSPLKIFTKHWSGYGWSGQYFFLLCFQAIALFPLLRKRGFVTSYQTPVLIATFLLYILFSYLPYYVPDVIRKISDRLIFYWIPYIILGIKLARSDHTAKIPGYIVICTALLVPTELMLAPAEAAISAYMRPSILLAVLLIANQYLKTKTNLTSPAGYVLSLVGKRSMSLYVMNPLFVIYLSEPMRHFQLPVTSSISYLFSISLVLTIALVSVFISSIVGQTFLRKVI